MIAKTRGITRNSEMALQIDHVAPPDAGGLRGDQIALTCGRDVGEALSREEENP
jgi:hypothetical protein